eukprot:2942441-Pyramimonas_sp.AAC.1
MHLFRPPPRDALQECPLPSVLEALQKFDARLAAETREIEGLALELQSAYASCRRREFVGARRRR